MLTFLWLIIATAIGAFIGNIPGVLDLNPEMGMYVGAGIGLAVGLIIRFACSALGDVFDIDGGFGGSDGFDGFGD